MNKDNQGSPYNGDPIEEILCRVRRVETRVTNMTRSLGLLPMTNSPNPMSPWVVRDGNTLYVSSPAATIGEISHAAVQGCGHIGGTFNIVLLNQPWGTMTVPDQIPQREKHD